MDQVTLEQVLFETGVKLDLLEKECAQDKILSLAECCDSLTVVGLALGLSEIQISDIDKDHRTTEEKRVALVQKWKQSSAFNATYKTFIQALLTCGRAEQATGICRLLAPCRENNEDNTNVDNSISNDENGELVLTSSSSTPSLVSSDETESDINHESTTSSSNDQPCDIDNVQFVPSKQSHEAFLQDKLDKLEHEYRMITFNFDQSLETVALKKLQSYAASLPIRVQRCYEELMTDPLSTKTKLATCASEFVGIVNKFSTFMNPALLGDAIKVFGDEKTKSEMIAYNSKLQEFQVSTKLKDFVNVAWEGVTPEEYEEIEVVLKSDWHKKTLKDISPPKRFWLLKKVFQGSLRVIFSIPGLMDLEEEVIREFLQRHVKQVFVKGKCILNFEMEVLSGQTGPEESKTVESFTSPNEIALRFSSLSCGRNAIVSEDGLEAHRRNVKDIYDSGVYSSTPLNGRVEFEIVVTDCDSNIINGSPWIGIAQTQRGSFKHLDIPHNSLNYYCVWCGKKVTGYLCGNKFESYYSSVDLRDLECGDRVGVRITFDGDLSFTFNGIAQGVAARNIYREDRDTYLQVFVNGSTTSVRITRAAMSDYDHRAEGHNVQVNQLERTVSPSTVQFKFHPKTGKNIMLLEDGLYARRTDPNYKDYDALVYGSVPIKHHGTFEVEIVEVSSAGFNIQIGVMRLPNSTELKQYDFPKYSDKGKNHCVWWRNVVDNRLGGNLARSFYGSVNLWDLQQGDKVGMRLSSDGTLTFFVNGRSQGVAVRGLNESGNRYDIYPVVDLQGKCCAVRITRAETHSEVKDLQELSIEKISSCLNWSSKDVNLLPLPQKIKNQIQHYIDYL